METITQILVGSKRWLLAVMFFTSVTPGMLAADGFVSAQPSAVAVDSTTNVAVGNFSAYVGGRYCTLFLPFGMDAVTAASWGDFYQFVALDGQTVRFEKVTRTDANTAYLFRPAAAKVSAANVEVKPVETVDETVANPGFEGTDVLKTLVCDEAYDYYYFVGSRLNRGQFVKVAERATINPNCAYIKVPRAMNAPARLNIDWGDGTTDMDDITGVDGDDDPALYDLQGTVVDPYYIPLPQTPTPKGIYIYHKKTLIID